MNLERKLEEKRLTKTTNLQSYRPLKCNLQKMRASTEVLSKGVDDMITKAVVKPRVHPKTTEWILNSVKAQPVRLTTRFLS